MELRSSLQVKIVLKALTDVVLPALDPNNKLAQEQARLCIGTLSIMASRMPLAFQFDCDKLNRLLELADGLQKSAPGTAGAGDALAALGTAKDKATDTLDRAKASPEEIEAASFDLREKIGALIPLLYSSNELDALKDVSKLITENAREQLVHDRSWLIGQGWEPDPKAIPPIETLLVGK